MTKALNFDPSRDPLPPDDELWGAEGLQQSAREAPDALDDGLRLLAASTYNVPGTAPGETPRDAMWATIAARRRSAGAVDAAAEQEQVAVSPPAVVVHEIRPHASRRWWPVLATMAATLAIGVFVGRGFDRDAREAAVAGQQILAGDTSGGASKGAATNGAATNGAAAHALPVMLARLTAEHFDRSEALLLSTRHNLDGAENNEVLGQWARELLTTTRLLLDTEQVTDHRLRLLLEDLELTLALILQAQSSGRATDAQAVRDDLESGDLLLRVRSAAMPTMLSTDDVRGMSE